MHRSIMCATRSKPDRSAANRSARSGSSPRTSATPPIYWSRTSRPGHARRPARTRPGSVGPHPCQQWLRRHPVAQRGATVQLIGPQRRLAEEAVHGPGPDPGPADRRLPAPRGCPSRLRCRVGSWSGPDRAAARPHRVVRRPASISCRAPPVPAPTAGRSLYACQRVLVHRHQHQFRYGNSARVELDILIYLGHRVRCVGLSSADSKHMP